MRRSFFISILFVFLFFGSALAASPARDIKDGNSLFGEEDYNSSIEKYSQALEKEPESDIINFNIGTAYYKKGDYEKAMMHLQKALLSEDDLFKKNAHYNVGNTFYRLGMWQREDNIDAAISSLKQSLGHFERTLKIDDKDDDAKYNYEFVKKELEKLLKEQQKQKQPKQDSKSQEKDDQQQDQGQSQQSDSQEKQDGGSSGEPDKTDTEKDDIDDSGKQEDQGSQKQDSSLSSADIPEGEMTQKEAEMILKGYQQNEEPKGLLNLMEHNAYESAVIKDW